VYNITPKIKPTVNEFSIEDILYPEDCRLISLTCFQRYILYLVSNIGVAGTAHHLSMTKMAVRRIVWRFFEIRLPFR